MAPDESVRENKTRTGAQAELQWWFRAWAIMVAIVAVLTVLLWLLIWHLLPRYAPEFMLEYSPFVEPAMNAVCYPENEHSIKP